MKYLIAGGDSFTAENFCWPHLLSRSNDLICVNNAVPSAGNDYICRSVINSIQKHLEQGVDPSDMVVVPLWTYVDRKSFFINATETRLWEDLTSAQARRHYSVNPVSFIEHQKSLGWYGVAAKAIDSGWVIGESSILTKHDVAGNFKKPYLLEYKTNEGSIIETLEWILFLQSFCNSHNIRLLNLAYSYESIFYYPEYNTFGSRNKNTHIKERYKKNCEHLVNLIDTSLWITQGLLDYSIDNNLPFMSDKQHPSEEAHLHYTKNIIEPRFKNL
jgi:hypothetical protein